MLELDRYGGDAGRGAVASIVGGTRIEFVLLESDMRPKFPALDFAMAKSICAESDDEGGECKAYETLVHVMDGAED